MSKISYEGVDLTMCSNITSDLTKRVICTSGKIHETLKKDGYSNRIFCEEGTDFKFVEILRNQKEQKLISLILKGIIPVASIVKDNNIYMSSVINPFNIIKNSNLEEINADLDLLIILFFDIDHDTYDGNILNIDNSKYYFFDFDINCFNEFYFNKYKLSAFFNQNFKILLNNLNGSLENGFSKEKKYSKDYLNSSVNMLNKRFLNNEKEGYLFFMILIKESGIDEYIGKKYWKIFRYNLININKRIKILDESGFSK